MSGRRVEMHRLQEMVRLHRLRTQCHEVARLLMMSPNTERVYREALGKAGLLEGPADELPEAAALRAAVLADRPQKQGAQERSTAEPWRTEIVEMRARGAQPKAIFDALKLEREGFTASLWAVKRLCRQLAKEEGVREEDVTIRVETAPGKVAQVDFGYVGELYDSARGLVRKAWVFVMVLGCSRHMFARVVFDQRATTWLQLHVEAFAALGGVPETLVPDNLKAAVVRAAFGKGDSPELNRSYREAALHYGFKIDPTPPRAPKKKGKVESGVKYVKNSFFKPRAFDDDKDANRRLDRWVLETAGMRPHGTTGRHPIEHFNNEERGALKSLPPRPFVLVVWKEATVHPDCHFHFERLLYPVPWRFIGKKVWLRANPRSVEVYFEDTRLITHERGVKVPPAILDQCLPPNRAQWRHRSNDYWLERADALGAGVGAYIREVFDCDDVLSQLRTVQSMVTHLERFPPKRANDACRRASFYGNHKYLGLRDILRKGLDMEPLPMTVTPRGHLENPQYARRPQELLQLPLEMTHEPN